jgi:hypothetical protein
MANIVTIGQAKIYALSLEKLTGIKPDMFIGEKAIRIYYTPDKLVKVQQVLEMKMQQKSDIQIDFIPMFLPILIRKFSLPLLSLLAAGYVIGKKI